MLVSLCNLAAGMAPNLGSSQTEDADMIIAVGNLKAVQVVNIVDCHERTIRRLCSNKRLFGNVKASLGKGGPPRSLNPVMVKTLCDHLLGKPNLDLYEMAEFIWNVFEKEVTCCPWAQLLRKRCTYILSNTPIPPSPQKKKKKKKRPIFLFFFPLFWIALTG